MNKITCNDVVMALKSWGLTITAVGIAEILNTDSRSVATAARAAVKDGRITITYRKPGKGQQSCGFYRFVRLTAKKS
ncbi:MAG: hypothetical protein V4641_05835 [Pseudomonadota bacterium]